MKKIAILGAIVLGIGFGIAQTRTQFPQQNKFGNMVSGLIGSGGQFINLDPASLKLGNNTLSVIPVPQVANSYAPSTFIQTAEVFTLAGTTNTSTMLVFRNGMLQEKDLDYTLNGTVVTFLFSLSADDRFQFLVQK